MFTGRFIPACAGNTAAISTFRRARTVHPRVRGEHRWRFRRASSLAGSSPRARGTLCSLVCWSAPRRFIPACAGNTARTIRPRPWATVHPRVRGEHCWSTLISAQVYGSSPRARGTLRTAPASRRACRFIPACAGNTVTGYCPHGAPAVHPRVRGEHNLSLGLLGMVWVNPHDSQMARARNG